MHATTARQKAIIAALSNGPMTTLAIIRAGLDPRAANNLYAEGRLEIGPAGYCLPKIAVQEFCGCGCGGFPNAKHEADLLKRYHDEWPRVPRTPWIAAHDWTIHARLCVVATRPITATQLDAMTDESGATEPVKAKVRVRRRTRHVHRRSK